MIWLSVGCKLPNRSNFMMHNGQPLLLTDLDAKAVAEIVGYQAIEAAPKWSKPSKQFVGLSFQETLFRLKCGTPSSREQLVNCCLASRVSFWARHLMDHQTDTLQMKHYILEQVSCMRDKLCLAGRHFTEALPPLPFLSSFTRSERWTKQFYRHLNPKTWWCSSILAACIRARCKQKLHGDLA